MPVLDTFLDAMGHTPLVRLRAVTRGVKPTILAKLEMLNPGGSVKDRIGLPHDRGGRAARPAASRAARSSSRRRATPATAWPSPPRSSGYRCIFVMPDKMSQEKIALLRAYGAEVVIAPTAVRARVARELQPRGRPAAAEIPGAFQPNQYPNLANPQTPLRDDRPGDLGADRRADRRLRVRRRHRRHDHRRRAAT